MSPRFETQAYLARWVLPIDGPPLEEGLVTVVDGRIAEVGLSTSADRIIDLGNGWLLPGLVNAHTHLELSHHQQPLGHFRQPFPEWIAEVVAWRRKQFSDFTVEELQQQRTAAIAQGLAESAAAGVVLVGDIASGSWPAEPYAQAKVSGVIFEELLGLAHEQQEHLAQRGIVHLDRLEQIWNPKERTAELNRATWFPGMSPHAPYTVALDLLRRICELSTARPSIVAMHLAESPDELELLASHSGRFVPMLEGLSAWHPESIPPGSCPRDYLELLSRAHHGLVVHGNFLTVEELKFLAQRRDSLSLVYCPRTHHYFHAQEHPLRAALSKGVRVALGTDSRASNPDLSIWNELRFLQQRYPDLSEATLLQMATLAGAEALGLADDYGSLTEGKHAALIVAEGAEASTPLFERTIRRLS